MKVASKVKKFTELNLPLDLSIWKNRINSELGQIFIKKHGKISKISEAMKYTLFPGGKRLRPLLCILSAEAAGGNGLDVISFACGIEMIHAYSLIHDDLPCMDNDDFRRGKPSCHRTFGEAIAVLAGDALLTEAFSFMSNPALYPDSIAKRLPEAIHFVCESAGWKGMVGGQAMEVVLGDREKSLPDMKKINMLKTAMLIEASTASGIMLVSGDRRKRKAMQAYGRALGMAFQLSDDIIDTGKEETSLPKRFGMNVAKKMIIDYINKSVSSLDCFGRKALPLIAVAEYVKNRQVE